jgi:hypothetical protein
MWWRSVSRAQSARKFLLYVIVAASIFSAAPVWAQGSVSGSAATPAQQQEEDKKLLEAAKEAKKKAEDFGKRVDELIKALQRKPADQKENTEPSPQEQAALATAISKVLPWKLAVVTWATDLAPLLADRKVDFQNPDLRAAISRVRHPKKGAAAAAGAATPPTGTKLAVQNLVNELEVLKIAGELPPDYDRNKLAQLATALSKLRQLDSTSAATLWANDLALILSEGPQPETDNEVKAALEKLAAAMPPNLALALNKKAEDLKKQIDALKPEIDKLKNGETLNIDEPGMANVATAISKSAKSEAVALAWAKALTDLLKPNDAAKRHINVNDERLREAVRKLVSAIYKFNEIGTPARVQPVAEIDALAAELAGGLEELKPAQADADKDLDDAKLTPLALAISKSLEPTLVATVWANDLAFILEERRPRRDVAIVAALNQLRKFVPAVPELRGPFLNIVQAWFGDVHYIRRAISGQLRINPATGTGPRVCDATNEVRSACQGKRICPFSPDPAAQTPVFLPDKAKLCGEHPVPFASKDVIGLAIEYQCLKAPDTVWDELQNNWRIEGDEYKPKMVILRTATEVILRCAAPLDQ